MLCNEVQRYINKVENAIDMALDQERWIKGEIRTLRTKLNQKIFNINGMSTGEVRILLNELVDDQTNYLEIGIHRGSTFISALYKNNPKIAIGIDHFGGPMYGDDVFNSFMKNCKDVNLNNFTIIKNDSFKLNDSNKKHIKDINLYFYDGGHSTLEHEQALTYYYEFLNDVFIFIVDDWVHLPAVEGTLSAIQKLNLTVHKTWELGYSQHEKNRKELSWHNGLYIAVMQK
jgi:hypothetical protein